MITQTTRELTYVAAVTEALRQEMRRDPHIFLIGENIAVGEGSFNATAGLLKEFGPERVLDTPISEAGFFGASVGAAMTGLKPVVELMFADFMGVTMDQILNQAAKLRYMSGGKIKVPLVVRTAWGGGISAASQHSQSLLSVVTHIPGLKCVAPSTPYDAKGLLISALRQDDPIFFFEHKFLYGTKGPVPEEDYTVPIGRAEVRRTGGDVTVVASGGWSTWPSRRLRNSRRQGRALRSSTLAPCHPWTTARSSVPSRRPGGW